LDQPIGAPPIQKVVISADQIQKRVRDMARQISSDYAGRSLSAVGILEDSFVFMSDLVRQIEVPVICQFVKPEVRELKQGELVTREILFSPEVDVKGRDVLLIETLLVTGITAEFLVRTIASRGAASVKTAALLDRQTARKVPLQPDYFGFLVDDAYIFGYGLGAPELGRNLPFLATNVAKSARIG
jgi:hypoxanthine phosphoribosyltransferase